MGAHNLADMGLLRNIPSDGVGIQRKSIDNPTFCIHTGNCPDLVPICVVQAFNVLFCRLIHIDDWCRFRQRGQDTRPVVKKVFYPACGMPGVKQLLVIKGLNGFLFGLVIEGTKEKGTKTNNNNKKKKHVSLFHFNLPIT